MKRSAALVLSVLLALVVALTAAPANAQSPYCGIRWGSLPKADLTMSAAQVTNVRAGRHACFDRLVLDVSGDLDGYVVEYVDEVYAQGSGFVVPVEGGARLSVMATAPVLPTDSWWGPDGEIIDTTGFRTFRDVAWAGSFEGQTSLGLGVRARLPFRVFVLDGPGDDMSRLVVDVAHKW